MSHRVKEVKKKSWAAGTGTFKRRFDGMRGFFDCLSTA